MSPGRLRPAERRPNSGRPRPAELGVTAVPGCLRHWASLCSSKRHVSGLDLDRALPGTPLPSPSEPGCGGGADPGLVILSSFQKVLQQLGGTKQSPFKLAETWLVDSEEVR